jgi:hypothetical protein
VGVDQLNLYFSLHDAVHVSGRRAVGCNVLGWRCVPPRLTYRMTETDIPSPWPIQCRPDQTRRGCHAQCQNMQKTFGLLWPESQSRLSCITGRFNCVTYFLTLKMEAASSFVTSTHNYFATQRLTSEEGTLIVIAVRVSNIAEEVVLVSSILYYYIIFYIILLYWV